MFTKVFLWFVGNCGLFLVFRGFVGFGVFILFFVVIVGSLKFFFWCLVWEPLFLDFFGVEIVIFG
jgi:hypothetical protein